MFIDIFHLFIYLQTTTSAVEELTTVIPALVASTLLDHSGVLVVVDILVAELFVQVNLYVDLES
jgi:hypothetical protein